MTTSAVSLDLMKAFDTVSHATLGSLSNDDDAATRTAIIIKQNNNFAVQHTFFYVSLPSLHDYNVKMFNFLFFFFLWT